MKTRAKLRTHATAQVTSRPESRSKVKAKGVVTTECYRNGELLWRDESSNIVVNVGLNYLIEIGLGNGTQIGTWFCGLMDATPTVSATNTMAGHAGWTEHTEYTAAGRPIWVDASTAVGQRDNSASKATYTISAATTVGGVFLVSTNTKGGTLGTLYSGVAFTGGNRAVQAADKLEVTYTQSVADDGA